MPGKPTLYVCSVDDRGPRFHPCKRVQAAMEEAGIDYDKQVGGRNHPAGIGVKGRRPELLGRIGTEKLPSLVLPSGAVLEHSKAILRWVADQRPDEGRWKEIAR